MFNQYLFIEKLESLQVIDHVWLDVFITIRNKAHNHVFAFVSEMFVFVHGVKILDNTV